MISISTVPSLCRHWLQEKKKKNNIVSAKGWIADFFETRFKKFWILDGTQEKFQTFWEHSDFPSFWWNFKNSVQVSQMIWNSVRKVLLPLGNLPFSRRSRKPSMKTPYKNCIFVFSVDGRFGPYNITDEDEIETTITFLDNLEERRFIRCPENSETDVYFHVERDDSSHTTRITYWRLDTKAEETFSFLKTWVNQILRERKIREVLHVQCIFVSLFFTVDLNSWGDRGFESLIQVRRFQIFQAK